MHGHRIRSIGLMLAAAFFLAPAFSGTPAPAPATPPASPQKSRIAIEKPIFEAGDVVRGNEINAEFVIRNTGDVPLKILSARPG